jgi:hypothetical protein
LTAAAVVFFVVVDVLVLIGVGVVVVDVGVGVGLGELDELDDVLVGTANVEELVGTSVACGVELQPATTMPATVSAAIPADTVRRAKTVTSIGARMGRSGRDGR